MLPIRRFYPSLKEFYLNIRNDAIYVLRYYSMKNGKPHYHTRYFTDIITAYNAISAVRTDSLTHEQLVNLGMNDTETLTLEIDILNRKFHIDRSGVIYGGRFTQLTQASILSYPSLAPRSIILRYYIRLANGDDEEHGINIVTTVSLREIFKLHHKSFNLIKIDSVFNPIHMRQFIYGYFSIERENNNQIMVFIDYSLIPNTDTTDYRIAIAPYPPMPILTHAIRGSRAADEPGPEIFLEYLEQHGTFYKFEDLSAVMDILQ